jgi:hypothetical protein
MIPQDLPPLDPWEKWVIIGIGAVAGTAFALWACWLAGGL